MPPCTLRVWHPHTHLSNKPSATATCSILPQQDRFLCETAHSDSPPQYFRDKSKVLILRTPHGLHVFSIFKISLKVPKITVNCSAQAQQAFYGIVLMVQQETEFLQDLVKDMAAALTGTRVGEKPQHFPLQLMDELTFPNASHNNLYI